MLAPDFGARLAAHLDACEVVGGAGAECVAAAAFAARWRFTAFVASCDAFFAQIAGQMAIA